MRRLWVIVCASGLLAAPLPGSADQQADNGTAFIFGQVVDANRRGVPGAIVTLNGGLRLIGTYTIQPDELPGGSRRTVTTTGGYFLFSGLTGGNYSVAATKAGYQLGGFGRQRPDGEMQTLHLGGGQRMDGVSITIWRLASISGRAVDEVGEPVVGAPVWALRRTFHTGQPRFERAGQATTDDRGMYRIANLTAGEYLVAFVTTRVTVPAPVVTQISQGFPNPTTSPELFRAAASIGLRPGPSGQRFGDWVLQGSPSGRGTPVSPGKDASGRMLVHPTFFYPAATSIPDAQVIAIGSGDERTGVDLMVHATAAVTVSGTLRGPEGPVPGVPVRLVPDYADELASEQNFDAAASLTDASGAFLFLGVPSGNYTLRAVGSDPAAPPPTAFGSGGPMPATRVRTLTANVPLRVDDQDLANVDVTLRGGFVLRGRYEFEGTSPRPEPRVLDAQSVMIQPLDGHFPGTGTAYYGQADADGRFTTPEIPAGRYVIRTATTASMRRAMEVWVFKDVVVNGLDVAGSPLELREDVDGMVIRFTDRPTEIAGVARTPQGGVDPNAAVLVISADPRDWTDFGTTPRRLRYIRASADGAYRIAGLPPGDYYVAAIPDAEASDWHDPRVLGAVSRIGARVSLGEDQAVRQDVTTRSIGEIRR